MLFRLLRYLCTTKNSDKEFLKVSFFALLRRQNDLTSGFTQHLAGFLFSYWRLTCNYSVKSISTKQSVLIVSLMEMKDLSLRKFMI